MHNKCQPADTTFYIFCVLRCEQRSYHVKSLTGHIRGMLARIW